MEQCIQEDQAKLEFSIFECIVSDMLCYAFAFEMQLKEKMKSPSKGKAKHKRLNLIFRLSIRFLNFQFRDYQDTILCR